MYLNFFVSVIAMILMAIPLALGLFISVLLIKALRKYIRSGEVRREKTVIRKSLAQALRENRTRCKMTQEFVAESLGVSRQAVSKWENGTSDPSTSNLCALANLYGIPVEELLNAVKSGEGKEEADGEKDP